ncbi:MAG: TadE/TadG family type IV pilus assembly protein [Hyphomicrobiales bacterium]
MFLCKFKKKTEPFVKSESGVTAIEFALLAPVFFIIVISILEVGYTFSKVAMLNYSVSVATKDIYIGKASNNEITHDKIEQNICDNMSVLAGSNCTENLLLELITINDVTDLPNDNAQCRDEALNINPVVQFDPGGSSETVFMRVCFLTNVLVPGIGFGLQLPLEASGKYAIIASSAFVNEPF